MRLLTFLLSTPSIFTPKSSRSWPRDADVVARPVPPKGDGVFSNERIDCGGFVCRYHGVVLTVEEEEALYPDRYPDYCLQIAPNLSIDGKNSGHWSRLVNHDENGNLKLHTDERERIAYFTAARPIAPGEELCFDYGVAYFVFRGITPAQGTESRSLELPKESAADAAKAQAEAPPLIPRSRSDIRGVTESKDLSLEMKKSALMRGLDFYGGVTWMDDGETVELPTGLDGQKRVYSYPEISLVELGDLLEKIFSDEERRRLSV